MIQRKGLLLVTMEPPALLEDEFQAWYDTEHLPQRRAIAGIESAQRFVCLTGWPRYLAAYDLSSPAVVDSEAYQAVSGPRATPWSQRILANVVGYYRAVAEQIYPGDRAAAAADQQPLRLVFMRFSQVPEEWVPAIVAGVQDSFAQQSGLVRLRIFTSTQLPGCDVLALADFHTLVDASSISTVSMNGTYPDLVNVYAPYWRRSERNRAR